MDVHVQPEFNKPWRKFTGYSSEYMDRVPICAVWSKWEVTNLNQTHFLAYSCDHKLHTKSCIVHTSSMPKPRPLTRPEDLLFVSLYLALIQRVGYTQQSAKSTAAIFLVMAINTSFIIKLTTGYLAQHRHCLEWQACFDTISTMFLHGSRPPHKHLAQFWGLCVLEGSQSYIQNWNKFWVVSRWNIVFCLLWTLLIFSHASSSALHPRQSQSVTVGGQSFKLV